MISWNRQPSLDFILRVLQAKYYVDYSWDTRTAHIQFRAQLSGSCLGDRYSWSIASSTLALNFLTPSFCGFLIRLIPCLGFGDFCWGRYKYGLVRRSISGVFSEEGALQYALAWYSRMGVMWSGSVAFYFERKLTCLEGCEAVKMWRLAESEL